MKWKSIILRDFTKLSLNKVSFLKSKAGASHSFILFLPIKVEVGDWGVPGEP